MGQRKRSGGVCGGFFLCLLRLFLSFLLGQDDGLNLLDSFFGLRFSYGDECLGSFCLRLSSVSLTFSFLFERYFFLYVRARVCCQVCGSGMDTGMWGRALFSNVCA